MHFIELQQKRILAEGRVLKRDNTIYMGHTNTRLSFAVKGSEIKACITTNHNLFPDYHCLLVYVDGELVNSISMKEKQSEQMLCYLEGDIPHIVTLHKISEAATNWIGIECLIVSDGALLNLPEIEKGSDEWTVRLDKHPDTEYVIAQWSSLVNQGFLPRQNAYKVLVLGDSITCGYGLAGDEYEDGSQTYAYLALKKMGYDVQYIAASGFGVYQDYIGDKGRTIPKAYPYTNYFMDKQAIYDVKEFEPQLIIIYLGTNDSYHFQKKGQTEAFCEHYKMFIERLHNDYPKAHFLLLAGMMTQDVNLVTRSLKQDLENTSEVRIDYLEFPIQDILTDGVEKYNHPSSVTHQKAAALLYEKLLQMQKY